MPTAIPDKNWTQSYTYSHLLHKSWLEDHTRLSGTPPNLNQRNNSSNLIFSTSTTLTNHSWWLCYKPAHRVLGDVLSELLEFLTSTYTNLIHQWVNVPKYIRLIEHNTKFSYRLQADDKNGPMPFTLGGQCWMNKEWSRDSDNDVMIWPYKNSASVICQDLKGNHSQPAKYMCEHAANSLSYQPRNFPVC